MKEKSKIPASVEAYIAGFDEPVKGLLREMRAIIRKSAPGADEVISYQMPTYRKNRAIVHFAGYKNHIGFYPAPSGIKGFEKELSRYRGAKGSVRFPLDEPLPKALIAAIVKFRVAEDAEPGKKSAKTTRGTTSPAKKAKATDADKVKAWLQKQDPAVRSEINSIRKIIIKAVPEIQERIKWNAPSYYLDEDVVTFGPYKGKVLLVFHHPAIIKVSSPFLEGNYKDRRLFYVSGSEAARKKELTRILQEVSNLISKSKKRK